MECVFLKTHKGEKIFALQFLQKIAQKPPRLLGPKYLYYILKNKDVVNFLQGLAESRSGTFPQITFSELSTIDINLPSLENQDIIVEIIDNIESKIENLEKINKNFGYEVSMN